MGIALGAGIGIPYGGKVPVTYLLHDEFLTDESAPMTSPRTAEPGPGTLTIVDSGDKFSISSGILTPSGITASWDPQIYSSLFTRTAGRALLGTINRSGDRLVLGWTTTVPLSAIGQLSGAFGDVVWPVFRAGAKAPDLGNTYWPNTGTDYPTAIVMRDTGVFGLTKIDGDWILHWVDNVQSVDVSAVFTSRVAGFTATLDSLRVTDLPAPWDSDYGIATERLAGSQSAGQTFTHEADCLIEFEATTLPSSGNVHIAFRQQDASNFWRIVISSTGDINLHEVVGGSPSSRGGAAGVIANGDRIMVVADDGTIKVYEEGTLQITYNSAANYKTETDGRVVTLGTGGAASDIISWPRVLSGAARATLEGV